jgi:hypothetical protein
MFTMVKVDLEWVNKGSASKMPANRIKATVAGPGRDSRLRMISALLPCRTVL